MTSPERGLATKTMGEHGELKVPLVKRESQALKGPKKCEEAEFKRTQDQTYPGEAAGPTQGPPGRLVN